MERYNINIRTYGCPKYAERFRSHSIRIKGIRPIRRLVTAIVQIYGMVPPIVSLNQRILGWQIQLADSVEMHASEEDVNVLVLKFIYNASIHSHLELQLAVDAYDRGYEWPPCDNFDDVCPLNLNKIGSYDSAISQSNMPDNMIVVHYKNGHRRAYNKYMYNDCIVYNSRDPLTRELFSIAQIWNLFRAVNTGEPFAPFYL